MFRFLLEMVDCCEFKDFTIAVEDNIEIVSIILYYKNIPSHFDFNSFNSFL